MPHHDVVLGAGLTSKDLRCVVRFDYGRCRAWLVRLERKSGTKRKLFSDAKYGGMDKALVAALAYRDLWDKRLQKAWRPSVYRPGPGTLKKGWKLTTSRGGHRCTYWAWMAWIKIRPGKLVATSWSIHKWGSAKAKRKTLQWLAARRREQKQNYKPFRGKSLS